MEPALRSAMPINMKRVIPLLLSGWISACINVPEIEPGGGNPQPDAGPAGVPDSGTPLSDLSVTITSPADTYYSSTSVSITVEVQGGVADTVQILKDGKLLATPASSPFQYTWDTTQDAEGGYSLTARAIRAGKTFVSEPVRVIIDRTNLQVASRSPAHGSTNVDFRAPFQVVFTKPVKATTVNDTTVSFAVAGIQADKTLSLSSDGKTLTITPKERPTLPATFSFGLSRGITDLAGNALANPITSSSSPWSFEVPDWYSFGGPLQAIGGNDTLLKDSTMVLDKQDNPIVAWSEELTPGGRSSLFVYHWDGKAFAPMGGAINATSTGSAFKASMALGDDGNPIIAWQESDGFNENIYVKRWTGSAWQTVGAGPLSAENDTRSSPVPTPARNPSLAVRGNEIYVAWDESTIDGYSQIHIWKSSNGTQFLGVGNNGGAISAVPYLTSGFKPSLVLDSNGQPIVAFQEETLDETRPIKIYVMRLLLNGDWGYAVPPFMNDDINGYVSGGLSGSTGRASANDCSLAIDAENNTYLSWTEESYNDGPFDTQVFRSVGPQSWQRVGNPLSAHSAYTSTGKSKIKSTAQGRIFVAWQEFSFDSNGDPGIDLFASTWNKTAWTNLSPKNGINQRPPNSLHIQMSVDTSERIIVAWTQSDNGVEELKGDRIQVRRHNK
jgi:hypothetical protein